MNYKNLKWKKENGVVNFYIDTKYQKMIDNERYVDNGIFEESVCSIDLLCYLDLGESTDIVCSAKNIGTQEKIKEYIDNELKYFIEKLDKVIKVMELPKQIKYENQKLDVCGYGSSDLKFIYELQEEFEEVFEEIYKFNYIVE